MITGALATMGDSRGILAIQNVGHEILCKRFPAWKLLEMGHHTNTQRSLLM